MLGLDTTLLQKALDNRIGCFAVILFLGIISQGLVSTGAFEVTFNGMLQASVLQYSLLCVYIILTLMRCARRAFVFEARGGKMANFGGTERVECCKYERGYDDLGVVGSRSRSFCCLYSFVLYNRSSQLSSTPEV